MSLGEVRDSSALDPDRNGRPDESTHSAVTAHAQAVAAERAHGPATVAPPPPPYAGLVTRAIAFAIDAAIVTGTGSLVGVVVGLGLTVLNTPEEVDKVLLAIGAVAFLAWNVGYFATFWATTGQTPGMRVMRIRVRQASVDESLRPGWALVRVVGLLLAALPLLLGFVPILVNDRRRGLQDFLARSVVVHAPARASVDETQVRSSVTS